MSPDGQPATLQGGQPSREEQKRDQRRSLREDAVNLPNMLTIGRIVIIPLVLVLLDRGGPRDCFWAAILFSAAAITDFLDGYLARRRGLESVLGKFLDPLADKLIVMASLVWMVPMGRIAAWVVVLLLARDLSITGLRTIAATEGLVIAAGESGKAKTALQLVGILMLMFGYPYRFDFWLFDLGVVDLVHIGRWLIYVSLVYSVISAVQYVGVFSSAIDTKRKQREKHA